MNELKSFPVMYPSVSLRPAPRTARWWAACTPFAFAVVVAAGIPSPTMAADVTGNRESAAQATLDSALHFAAYNDDVEQARQLLDDGSDANAVNIAGMTPLMLACENGSTAMARLLLEHGADAKRPMHNGETPLMMAARNGNVELIELLLARGAEINATESLRGSTPLMWAVSSGNRAAAQMLLARGADVEARSGTTQLGRRPYLAPPARERIQEFIDGTGLRGADVTTESGEPDADQDLGDLSERTTAQIVAAREIVAHFPKPAPYQQRTKREGGGLSPLILAAREGHIDIVEDLLAAGADVNGVSEFGWTALLTATQNRNYQLGLKLLAHGADPNIANAGGWNPLYIATDNRNIEGGDYPTRKPDLDHLEFIKALLAAGANPNLRMGSSTETRTIFTHQWLHEEGATPFLRAAQSGDLELMRLLLDAGADPSIPTAHNVTPLMVACGIGWVEGVTYEWSPQATYDTVKLLLDLGAEVNAQDNLDGRTALMGAAHKGRSDIVRLLVDHGADLALRDIGSRDSTFLLAGATWQAIDYADGLVRVGVQSAVAHPDTANLLREMMIARGLEVPEAGRTLDSICVTDLCR